MKTIVTIAVSVACLGVWNSFGKDTAKANPFNEILSSAPAVELPAKAADLVLQARARDRQAVTLNAVKGAVGINPAAAPAIVGAVARAVPEMASVAAGAAATEQPKQASAIAKAAAAAAPSQAGRIVAAVCRAVPNEYRKVALAVSEAVPNAGEEILRAVGSALPELKPSIEKAMAGNSEKMVSVALVLDQAGTIAAPTLAGATPLARGPTVGPAFVPLTTTPANVTPGTSSQVPPGRRNYATP